jgi:hypothetical protein
MNNIKWQIARIYTKQPENKNKAVDWKCFNESNDKTIEGTNVISDDLYNENLSNEEILELCFQGDLDKNLIESYLV